MLTPMGKLRYETPTGEPDPVSPEPDGPLVLRLPTGVKFTDEQIMEMSSLNPELRIEINALGVLELLLPTNSITGYRNAGIAAALGIWTRDDGLGVAFDASVGFTLPNGALRSPDASWVLKSRLAELSDKDPSMDIPRSVLTS